MKIVLFALILVAGALLCGACSSGDNAVENQPLTAEQQATAAAAQQGGNGIKAKNGGGIVPVEDGPPPPGAKTGMPTVGGKAAGGN